jgi:thiosulfate dehydrogenase (quinone) large subunit
MSWTLSDRGYARMFARVMVGIIFLMAGYWKCFELTPMQHARGMFVEGFAHTWIPTVLLWALGLSIPVFELVAGGLLVIGFRTREALLTIGFILLTVTYGHTLLEPLYSIKDHILPRTLLMLAALVLPEDEDRWTVDYVLKRRKARAGA